MATNPYDRDSPAEEPTQRRLQLRRGRANGGGFGPGVSTTSESYSGTEDDDIDNEESENVDLNERVHSLPPPLPAPPTEQPDDDPLSGDDVNSMRRMAEVALAGSPTYAKEFRLDLLHRLLMRKMPLDAIARTLRVSVSTVEKDRVELKKRLRQTARELNIDEMIGGQLAFYDEAQSLSLRLASTSTTPTPMKLAAIRTALASNADKARFLANAGVFEVLSFRRNEEGADLSDVQILMQQTAEMLSRLDADEPDVKKPAAKRVARSRPGGFKPMTFDETEGSSGDNEIQEL